MLTRNVRKNGNVLTCFNKNLCRRCFGKFHARLFSTKHQYWSNLSSFNFDSRLAAKKNDLGPFLSSLWWKCDTCHSNFTNDTWSNNWWWKSILHNNNTMLTSIPFQSVNSIKLMHKRCTHKATSVGGKLKFLSMESLKVNSMRLNVSRVWRQNNFID